MMALGWVFPGGLHYTINGNIFPKRDTGLINHLSLYELLLGMMLVCI
jgi:hypothetical protein